MKATLVFIFGPNLKTKTLLRPGPKLNNISGKGKAKPNQPKIYSRHNTIKMYQPSQILQTRKFYKGYLTVIDEGD